MTAVGYRSPRGFFRDALAQHPAKPALVGGTQSLTYAELGETVEGPSRAHREAMDGYR